MQPLTTKNRKHKALAIESLKEAGRKQGLTIRSVTMLCWDPIRGGTSPVEGVGHAYDEQGNRVGGFRLQAEIPTRQLLG